MQFQRMHAMMGAIVISAAILGLTNACSDDKSVDPPEAEPVAPPPSVGHGLVYHDSLDAILLVNSGLGGMVSPPATAKTILYKWTNGQWYLLDSAGPPIRNLGGVAYDIARNALVLHGGSYSLDQVYGETWEWHPTRGWTNKGVGGPGARDHMEMAYDATRSRVILYGGQVTLDSFPGDTWTWDGATWERVSITGPGKRVHHTLAYEPTLGRVILFGGYKPPTADMGDTWSWNGTQWETAAANITPRTHARIGHGPSGLLLVGGFPAGEPPVMRLESGTWSVATQTPDPGPRYLTALAFDPNRNVTVLFGGGDPGSDEIFSDTWEFDQSSGWTDVTPVNSAPTR